MKDTGVIAAVMYQGALQAALLTMASTGALSEIMNADWNG